MNLGTEKYLLYSTPENGGSLRLIRAPKDDSYHPQLSQQELEQLVLAPHILELVQLALHTRGLGLHILEVGQLVLCNVLVSA